MRVVVETRDGKLAGRRERGVEVFRGVPFAAAPTGPRRFRPPEPPEPWPGVREAETPGPAAPQNRRLFAALPGLDVGDQDEDCLTLNLTTPRSDDGRRPVLVWIHGGAFVIGSGSQLVYDAAALARRGDVVVITIHYRLGALGFLHLSALSGENGGGGTLASSGNAGLLDQIAALHWVRANVERFGGDPENVTVFGESAGGMSVATLLGTPRARGLFRRAIAQSGSAQHLHTEESAARVAHAFLEELGLEARDAEKLRDVPVERLLRAQEGFLARLRGARHLLAFQPVIDGRIVPEPPLEAVQRGEGGDVALLVGTTRDEWNLFALTDPRVRSLDEAGLLARARTRVGSGPDAEDRARQLVAAYREALDGSGVITPAKIFVALETDRVFRLPAIRLAEAQQAHLPATYAYLFTWESPALGGAFGACHAIDVPFVFGTHTHAGLANLVGDGPAADALATRVMEAWLAFARDGSPQHAELSPWPGYEPERRVTMLLGAECRAEEDPEAARRRAWDRIQEPPARTTLSGGESRWREPA